MYRMNGRIRYSECGTDNKLTLAGMINYFQDCSSENSELLGVGVDYMRERQKAWVLSTWQIEVERYPSCSEKIAVETWATGFKGILGPRDFCMKTEDGEILARATTLWVFVDAVTGKPTRPEERDITPYVMEAPQEMEKVSRKIALPDEAITVDTFPVRKYHIDTNNHVNNAQYIQIAAEVLPEGYRVDKLRAEYKRAAVLGDEIVLKYAKEDDRIVTMLCDKEDTVYVVVEFRGEE